MEENQSQLHVRGRDGQLLGCEERVMLWKGMVLPALVCAGMHALAAGAALAQTSQEPVLLVLSNLPSGESNAYKAIRARAGEAAVQALTLTKTEMWSVPGQNAEAVVRTAQQSGVEVSRLEENWNHILARAPADASASNQQRSMMQRAMASKAASGIALLRPPPAGVVEYALTRNLGVAGDTSIRVSLSQDQVVTVRRTRVSVKDDMLVWRGRVEGTGAPATLMWWPGALMTGTISHEGQLYSIRRMQGATHAMLAMRESGLPQEHASIPERIRRDLPDLRDDPLVQQGDASILRTLLASLQIAKGKLPRPEVKVAPPADSRSQSGPPAEVVIDVIVAYTRKVAEKYTDVARELVELAIEESNEAFRISNIGHVKLRLVHAYQTSYVEEGSHFDHVWRFADVGDGHLEEIHGLRDQHRADVAILVVDDDKGCGLATRVYADAEEAFAVVHHECAVLTYSIAHEIGHLIGARHELSLDKIMTPFPYGHGYVNGNKWRDIMSYRESCGGCRRVPVWSSPKVLVNDEPAGTAEEDNARVIAEQAARVAAFR
jgi:hypothetical protein